MKLYNAVVNGKTHLCIDKSGVLIDLNRFSDDVSMETVIRGDHSDLIKDVMSMEHSEPVMNPVITNVVSAPVKLLCVGLNYQAHADGAGLGTVKKQPVLFSKFFNSLSYDKSDIALPPWEHTYDYEAELVIVMGRRAWNVDTENAMDYVFGFTCGNDLSCRDAQKRTSQWLVGKTLPGFGPCGPCIVTKDEIDLKKGLRIQSFVNGELRQDGCTTDMIFSCEEIISYASKYIMLEPGDMIFTGTPAGVQLEKESGAKWLVPGDVVSVCIENIGTLTNFLK